MLACDSAPSHSHRRNPPPPPPASPPSGRCAAGLPRQIWPSEVAQLVGEISPGRRGRAAGQVLARAVQRAIHGHLRGCSEGGSECSVLSMGTCRHAGQRGRDHDTRASKVKQCVGCACGGGRAGRGTAGRVPHTCDPPSTSMAASVSGAPAAAQGATPTTAAISARLTPSSSSSSSGAEGGGSTWFGLGLGLRYRPKVGVR